jgi:hypothetical protein
MAAGLLAAGARAVSAHEDAPDPAGFFRLQSAVKLAGKAPDWDYLAYDAARHHLFIARRDDGLWIYDTRARRLIRKMPQTKGAGATLLIPALGRGYTTNEDGSTTIFALATLTPLRRIKFAGDADSAAYEPVSGQIGFISADSQKLTFMDARTLKLGATVALASKKPDGAAADGAGHILLAERDRDMLARIDVASGRVVDEWPLPGCSQPTGLDYDGAHHRAFVGCRSAKPVLAVVDTDHGQVVATLALGHGNDGVVYDAARSRVITTNGIEGNIVVFGQDDADHYHFAEATTTRPSARTLAYDAAAGVLFTVTAEGYVDPKAKMNAGPSAFYPNGYYDGSFVVLTYSSSF